MAIQDSIIKLQKELERYIDTLNLNASTPIDIPTLMEFLHKNDLRIVDYLKLVVVYKKLHKNPNFGKLLIKLKDFQVFDSKESLEKGKPSNQLFYPEQLERLLIEGWLEKTEIGIKTSKKFNDLYVNREIAGTEIYNMYPVSNLISNERSPIKAIDKIDFIRAYAKVIGDGENVDSDKHIEFKELFEFAVEKSLPFPNMDRLLNQFSHWKKRWEEIRADIQGQSEDEEIKTLNVIRKTLKEGI